MPLHASAWRWSAVLTVVISASLTLASPPPADWSSKSVDWGLPNGLRIRAIHQPAGVEVRTSDRVPVQRPARDHRQVPPGTRMPGRTTANTTTAAGVPANVPVYVINSPPIDGFVPYIAVLASDKHKFADWQAEPSIGIQGNLTVTNPQTDYGIGLFDTGAGISVLSHETAVGLNLLTSQYNTGGTVPLGGVTGTVNAWVSQPYGLWVTGFSSINPDTMELDTTNMVGEYHVSTALGQAPAAGAPDIATAIGAPMAVFYATSIRNSVEYQVNHNGKTYRAPEITFYDLYDPAIPEYPNILPLELRPSGAAYVWYWPCLEPLDVCPGGDDSPKLPSFIIGANMQSLYFVGSVNVSDAGHSANGLSKFMLDTGAQITVVGSRVAASLALNPNKPDFQVEVQGVDGQVVYEPGFFVDTLDVPVLGDWLSYTKIPVVMLDVASPEGGTLDGILGMNLFLRYNLVVRGGGMNGQPAASLDFEPLPGVYADFDWDNDIDAADFAFMQRCLTGYRVPVTDPDCYAALLDADDDIDEYDVDIFIYCAKGPNITPDIDCMGG